MSEHSMSKHINRVGQFAFGLKLVLVR